MVTTARSMDSRSLDIRRDGNLIGYVQWHPEREPRIVICEAFGSLSLSELETVMADYRDARHLPAA